MSPNSKGIEILSIGTELLLGNIVNTNAQWISDRLSQLGLNHFRQSTVGDNYYRIIKVIQEISKRSNLLITTGGLGPTPDDLTTEAIAKSFNVSLSERPHLWYEIKQKLPNSKLKDDSSSLRKQCFFPKNAQIINNPRGTAPGMIWEPIKGFTILTFPGVPSEMKTMWEETAYDFIKSNKFLFKKRISLLVSNSLIHHITNLEDFFNTIRSLSSNITVNFHKDLKRPLDEKSALELKAKCSTKYNEILTNDYYASLKASYTFKELKNFILENDLFSLDVFEEGENYLIVYGNV